MPKPGCRLRLRPLVILAVASHFTPIAAVIPDPITEQHCKDCEQALQKLKSDRSLCENDIQRGQVDVSGKIAGFHTYFKDVENQMKKLEPEKAKLESTLSEKYQNEAKLYGELHKEAAMTTAAFLHRRDSRGDPTNQLIDRWLKCDDDRIAAEVGLNGCRTRGKTVQMWNEQRKRQYKDKADVYIMRVSRQADPLSAQLKESDRVSATINRITPQIQTLKTERTEMLCPSSCSFPNCHPGEPANGGVGLADSTLWGTRGCTQYCSRQFGADATRFCGSGDVYLDGANVDCTRCVQTTL